MEVWRQCAHWLVAARVLPAGHRASSPGGRVWDLAQALRDGVLLCHLLNALLPRAIPNRDICPRPQMSQKHRMNSVWMDGFLTPTLNVYKDSCH